MTPRLFRFLLPLALAMAYTVTSVAWPASISRKTASRSAATIPWRTSRTASR